MPARNRIFTGRKEELAALHVRLQTGNAALSPEPAALHGMGGVGKTQTAAQYVHLHQAEYALIMWVRGDTPADFKAQIAGLASKLDPAIPVQAKQEAMFQAAQQWLNAHAGWLLVVDNAQSLPDLHTLLPEHPRGRVLLTTRERVPPNMADGIEIHHLDETTGATLLLRRAGILQADAELDTANAQTQTDAQEVSRTLGGLALALDQAGAYMHERDLPPATYLNFYRQRHQELHKTYRNDDHASVSVTFDLALEQVRQIPEYGLAAEELAQLCAFLAPDLIPDEVFLQGASALPDALAAFAAGEIGFADVYEAATRYALLHRASKPSGLSMHRVAQEALRDHLSNAQCASMAEQVMKAVNEAFPDPDFPTWALCARLLPHALVCVGHIEKYAFHIPSAVRLCARTAAYLRNCSRYMEAEPLLLQALAIGRELDGAGRRELTDTLNYLGLLYRDMGHYEKAAQHLEEAVAIACQAECVNEPQYAVYLDSLAQVYYRQDRYDEAIQLHLQALDIIKRTLGTPHRDVASGLNNLGNVYARAGRLTEAEALLKESKDMYRQLLGANHPDYLTSLENLASVYVESRRPDAAELLLQEALKISKDIFSLQDPHVAYCYYWLGAVQWLREDMCAAGAYFRQALEIWERTLGPQHPYTRDARKCLAWV